MQPRFSLWAYPWDISAIGIREALQEIHALSINTVSMATAYHAGLFLQPRNPERKVYFLQDGTIYFHPGQHYGRIQPEVAVVTRERNITRELAEQAEEIGLQLAAWTVCLHNTRIGTTYPDVTTINAFGDRTLFSLCPSHPDVQQYITTLIADISRQPGISSIELESLNYMGFEHGFHHEKDGVGLTPLDQFLFSLCFCPHCMQSAQASAIDAQQAHNDVKEMLTDCLRREIPDTRKGQDFLEQGLALFEQQQALHDYLLWRTEPVTHLLEQARAATAPGVELIFLDAETPNASWMYGVDYARVAEICDGNVTCCYGLDAAAVTSRIAEARSLAPHANLIASFRLFHPEMPDAAALTERVAAAHQAGVQGVAMYNYGLVPQARMRWIRDALLAWQ
ncbi:MAG TPA: hypothetical protein VKR06_21440 [Ktedonosporobacter sp.]|nr:hypothetical protein [Ktedonosporobacter sp.]